MRHVRGDQTPYSSVAVCTCGARFAAATRAAALRLLAVHETRAGCPRRAGPP